MRLYELYQVRSACFKIYHSTCRTPNEDISRRPSDMTSWGEALVMLPIYGRECHGRRSNFGKDWGDGYLPVSSRLNFPTSFGYLEVFCVNQCFLFNCLFSFFLGWCYTPRFFSDGLENWTGSEPPDHARDDSRGLAFMKTPFKNAGNRSWSIIWWTVQVELCR